MPTNSGVLLKSECGNLTVILKDKTEVYINETTSHSYVEVNRKDIKFRTDGIDSVILWKKHDGGVSVVPANELDPKELKALLPRNIILFVKNNKAVGIEIVRPLRSKNGK